MRDDGWSQQYGVYRINMTIRYKVCRSERFVHSIGSPRSLGQGEVCGTVSEGLFKGPNKPQDANLWGFEKDTKS